MKPIIIKVDSEGKIKIAEEELKKIVVRHCLLLVKREVKHTLNENNS